MTNTYFNHTPLARFTIADAVRLNSIFDAVEAAFDKLPSTEEMNQGGRNFSIATGPANNYSVTVDFQITGYTAGLQIRALIMIANTGPSTLNVNSMGQGTIKRADGTNLIPGDLRASSLNDFTYDGTNFRLTSFHGASEALSAASANTAVAAAASAGISQVAAASSASSAAASAVTASSNATTAVGVLSGARFGLKNLLINNLFWVSQRLPTTFSGTHSNVFIRDRWRVEGGTNWSILNSTLTINTGSVHQIIQGRNVPFAGQYTLSWIGTASAYVNQTWPTINTINVTNGVPFTLPGYVHCAVTFHSGTVYLPQLEFGPVKSSPELRSVDLDLVLCAQYYQKSYALLTAPGATGGLGSITTRAQSSTDLSNPQVPLYAEMRAAPAVIIYSPVTGLAGRFWNTSTSTDGLMNVVNITSKFFYVNSTAAAFTTNSYMHYHWTADAEL